MSGRPGAPAGPPAEAGVLAAITVLSAIAVGVLLLGTQVVGELAARRGVPVGRAGFLVSVELIGMALAGLAANLWIDRAGTVRATRLALLGGAALNLLAAWTTRGTLDLPLLMVLRFGAGLPSGSVMVVCLRSVGQLRNLERGYALHTLGQVAFGVVGLALVPHLFAHFGLGALYLVLAVFQLGALPLSSWLVQLRAPPARAAAAPGGPAARRLWCLAGVVGVFLFYAALFAVWTFAESIGVSAGIGREELGYVLSGTAALGVAGSLLASLVGGRVSRPWAAAVGLSLMTASVALFLRPLTPARFVAAAALAKLTWTFVLPFLLGAVTELDRERRVTTNLFLVISAGLAAGPALGSAVMDGGADLDRVVIVSTGLMVACTVLMTLVAAASRRLATSGNGPRGPRPTAELAA